MYADKYIQHGTTIKTHQNQLTADNWLLIEGIFINEKKKETEFFRS